MTVTPEMRGFLAQQLQLSRTFLKPLHFAVERPRALYALFTRMGWNLEGLLEADPLPLTVSIEAAQTALDTLVEAAQEPDSEAVAAAAQAAIENLLTRIDEVRDTVLEATISGLEPEVVRALADDLVDYLILRWLAEHAPELTSLGRLLGIIRCEQRPALRGPANQLLRFPVTRWALHLDDVWTTIANPLGSLLRAMPQSIPTAPEAYVETLGDLVRQPLLEFVASFGGDGIGDWAVTLDPAGIQVASTRLPFAADTITPINFVWPDAPHPTLTLSPGVWRLDWTVPAPTDAAPQALLQTSFFTLSAPHTGASCDPPSLTLAVRDQLLDLDANGALRLSLNTVSGPVYGEVCGRLNCAAGGKTLQLSGTLVWDADPTSDAVEIGVAGFDVVTLSFGDEAPGVEVGLSLDLYPEFALSIGPVELRVNVKSDVLQPVERVNPDGDAPPIFRALEGTRISIPIADVVASFSLSDGITIESDYSASLPPVMIGSTGVVIEAANIKLVLSEEDAVALGGSVSPDARGLFVDGATIYLPEGLSVAVPTSIDIDDCMIGPAGFSGRFDGHWTPTISADGKRFEVGPGAGEVFGVPFALDDLTLRFVDNIPIEARIEGRIVLPYFDEPVSVRVNLDVERGVTVTLKCADEDGITLTKEELLALSIQSLGIGVSPDGIAEVEISGDLQPLLMSGDGLEWPKLTVTDLAIDTRGRFRIKEAWLDLKELATLDLFGFHFELNRIGLGYQETDDKLWIDLTGSLRLIEQIPVGLGIEGFRLTWPRDLSPFFESYQGLELATQIALKLEVQFDGVQLFFGVPGAIEFEGSLGFMKSAQVVGFRGEMALRVPSTGLAIEAGLMVGINFEPPPYPFLLLTFGVELPAGIPLAQSGLALKGAKGLFGLNVSPTRTEDQHWYYDWYKPDRLGPDDVQKWKPERSALALGMGLTVTTVDGYVKGVRGLLVLAIPGPTLIIQGRALIFDGLTPSEPPLSAAAIIDGKQQTIQFNIEAEAVLIEDMLEAYGVLDAFFDFKDLTNWHLYLGQDQPLERRIQASVLKFGDAFLFKADAYLMVDMIGSQTLRSRMGVYVGFKPSIPDFGPVKITFDAVLEGQGMVTVLPSQFSGEVHLSANIELKAFCFGLQLAASAGVLTEGPKPLKVDAELTVSAELPWPFDPFKETLQFTWEAKDPPKITSPLVAVTADSPFAPGGGALQIRERADVALQNVWRPAAENSPVVPIDTRPVLSFSQEMNDGARAPDRAQPQPAFARHPDGTAKTYEVGLMRFTPTLRTVRLYEHRKGEPWPSSLDGWKLIASSLATDIDNNTDTLPGVWMAEADPQDPGKPPARRLHLWTNNPLLHAAQTLGSGYAFPCDVVGLGPAGVSHAQQLLDLHPDLMKCDYTEPQRFCVDFDGVKDGARLQPDVVWKHGGLHFKAVNPASVPGERPPPPRLDLPLRVKIGLALSSIDLRFINPQLINERMLLTWARSVNAGQQNQIRHRHPDLKTVWEWLWPASRKGRCLVGRGRFSIRFPEPVRQVWIRFCEVARIPRGAPSSVDTMRIARTPEERKKIADEAKGKKTVPDLSACVIPVVHQVDVTDDTWVIRADEGFECLGLFKKEDFAIAEICYLTVDEVARAARAATQCRANNNRDEEPQNVLQPGSYYRLDIETKVTGDLPSNPDNLLYSLYSEVLEALGENDSDAPPYKHVAFFQTEGPPTSLARYIKWSNPQHQAPRFFRHDDLAIRFLRPNMREMYDHPRSNLEMAVRSAEGRLIRGYTTTWKKAGSASLLHEEQLWREHRPEVGLTNAAVETDDELKAARTRAELEPKARYELLISGGEGGALLFEDNFIDLSGKTWKPNLSGWTAQSGVLTRQNTNPAHITTGDSNWTDLDLTVELKLTKDHASGVLVRAASTSTTPGNSIWNACRISLLWQAGSGEVELHLDILQRNPAEDGPLVPTSLLSRTVTLPSGLWTRLRVSLVANRLRVWLFDDLVVDGVLYQVVRDWTSEARPPGTLFFQLGSSLTGQAESASQRGDLLPSTQGQIGLYAAGRGPEFRRMRVRDAVLHRVSFTSSAFAGFRELLESGKRDREEDGNIYAPISITVAAGTEDIVAAAAQATTNQTTANLPYEFWTWDRAQVDFRFEELDRKGLEERKLVLREARASHDAAFRSLAEFVSPELLYLPVADHIELYLLRNSDAQVFGLWLRSPESLDLRQTVTEPNGNNTNRVGRTTISLNSGLGINMCHDADSSQVLIFRKNAANTGSDLNAWPGGVYHLTLAYQRDHGDEVGAGDHRYDRPVELTSEVAVIPPIIFSI